MLVCKNIQSGKFFIYIREVDWGNIQVVNPLNRIKTLERKLFDGEVDADDTKLVNSGAITEEQLKVYRNYQRSQEPSRYVSKPEKTKVNSSHNKGANMKTIEIDDEVYEFLKNKADPFKEINPNLVLRRLLLKKESPSPPKRETTPIRKHQKAPKNDLSKLVLEGFLQEGQVLTFNSKGKKLSKSYEARVSTGCLLFEGNRKTMSALVANIFTREGLVTQSGSYRGPDFWQTSDGKSVRQLWDRYLEERA